MRNCKVSLVRITLVTLLVDVTVYEPSPVPAASLRGRIQLLVVTGCSWSDNTNSKFPSSEDTL
jgi:hypothetical protein